MIENIWLYFFSSLMQTSASLIALFSVFVVFKIDKINNKIDTIRQLIIKVFIKIKNNETTPGAELKMNKKFCEKFNIGHDKHTYEKYNDAEILYMFKEFWDNKEKFIATMQFGNDLITEETLILLSKFINDKKIILRKLVANLIAAVLLIVLSSMFLSFPNQLRDIALVYTMVIFISTVAIYNAYSIYYIAKSN